MLFCTETCSTFALDNEARTHNVSGERMQNKVALKKKKLCTMGKSHSVDFCTILKNLLTTTGFVVIGLPAGQK